MANSLSETFGTRIEEKKQSCIEIEKVMFVAVILLAKNKSFIALINLSSPMFVIDPGGNAS